METNILRIHCPKCGGPISVHCEEQDSTAGPQAITCPWCQHVEHRDVGAVVQGVTKGHAQVPRV